MLETRCFLSSYTQHTTNRLHTRELNVCICQIRVDKRTQIQYIHAHQPPIQTHRQPFQTADKCECVLYCADARALVMLYIYTKIYRIIKTVNVCDSGSTTEWMIWTVVSMLCFVFFLYFCCCRNVISSTSFFWMWEKNHNSIYFISIYIVYQKHFQCRWYPSFLFELKNALTSGPFYTLSLFISTPLPIFKLKQTMICIF